MNIESEISESVHPFDRLPLKVQRVWIEEYGEPKNHEVLLASWDGNVMVFSFDGVGLGFQFEPSIFPSMPDLRYCSHLMWRFMGKDELTFIEHSRITDNREESWVNVVMEPLIELSKTPGIEEPDAEKDS